MGATCIMAMKKFFKVLVLWNSWSDFEIISQKRSLDDPFQNMFAKLLFVRNMALVIGATYTVQTWKNY